MSGGTTLTSETRVYHLVKGRVPTGAILVSEGDWLPPPEIRQVRDPAAFERLYTDHIRGLVSRGVIDLRGRLLGRDLCCACPGPRSPRCPARILLNLLSEANSWG